MAMKKDHVKKMKTEKIIVWSFVTEASIYISLPGRFFFPVLLSLHPALAMHLEYFCTHFI
jgi:hypothetical protein